MFNFVKKSREARLNKKLHKLLKVHPYFKDKDFSEIFDTRKYCNQLLEQQAKNLNLSADQLKEIWINNYFSKLESNYKEELDKKLNDLKENYKNRIQQIIINSFDRLDYQYFRDEFIIKVPAKNPEIRSRLVGLNARNKKTFERICGVELIIKDNDENVYLSSANHVKREIAYRVLKRLLEIKNIEPNKISNYYNEEKINFLNSLASIGEETVKQLKFKNINPNLYEYIGKLRYRYSFGQNVLEHSIESALLAEQIAHEVGADPYLAKLCAFFHDIGKSMDHETGMDHIQLGVEIAQKNDLPKEVISGIATHHSSQISNNIYDAIVKISDKSSASRPGARNNTKENFYKRVQIYEDICMKFNEVQHVWVLQSGFVIKILLKPNIISDSEIEGLIERIKLAFESNKLTSEYILTIEIIKENTYQFKTKKIIQ